MAQNCSWKMFFLGWLISYLTHQDHCSLPYQQQIGYLNTKEEIPVSVITTLSEAFGVEGFTISISWSWILKQWREFNKVHGIPCRWMGDTRCRKQVSGENLHANANYKCYWVTSKNSSECQRLIANMKKQKHRHSILPTLANMATGLWLSRWQQIFFCNVTHVSIQDKCSFNQTIRN